MVLSVSLVTSGYLNLLGMTLPDTIPLHVLGDPINASEEGHPLSHHASVIIAVC